MPTSRLRRLATPGGSDHARTGPGDTHIELIAKTRLDLLPASWLDILEVCDLHNATCTALQPAPTSPTGISRGG
jgi:hypothetical protein